MAEIAPPPLFILFFLAAFVAKGLYTLRVRVMVMSMAKMKRIVAAKATVWYTRCPMCHVFFTGMTEKYVLTRALEHARHRHGTENIEFELKCVEVNLE